MKDRYIPRTYKEKMGYLVEECGEVLTAAGKTLRWGPDSANLELPVEERETNRDWLLREFKDLERAIAFVRREIGPSKTSRQTLAEARGAFDKKT